MVANYRLDFLQENSEHHQVIMKTPSIIDEFKLISNNISF